MGAIRFKKPLIAVGDRLRNYLAVTNREIEVPIGYPDLLRYNSAITLLDKRGK
ncbi:MAG: hypothetical protein U5K54_25395 [Cytophagales bacterium]|nr:hypothetical protein [Cytophagales bacterium]